MLLKNRNWIYASITFLIGVSWLAYHLPVSLYLESLGVDSFAESKNFDLDEAKFWFQTLDEAIYPSLSIKKLLVYLAFSLASFFGLKWLLDKGRFSPKRSLLVKIFISVVMIGLAFQQTTSKALVFYFDNSELFLTTAKNFDNEAPEVKVQPNKTSLIVYIGESTSVMNMGLYGYPRQTTPLLSELAAKDKNLIVFDNVFSTHVLTSRSLLEALSLGLDKNESFLPITKRKRISIVELLKKGNLKSTLISNQGVGGSWDQAASVVFKNSNKIFSMKTHEADDRDRLIKKTWDDEFFEKQLNTLDNSGSNNRNVIFLHSYAGHGPYFGNIPERFRKPVDKFFTELGHDQRIEGMAPSTGSVDEYDAAIKYVDYSVSKAISRVREASRPMILVYFSDHGDAVFSGIGHDSARFKHEMARIPFIIYFNDAAKKENFGLFEKYQDFARKQEISTLAQLPSTLMDLLGIRISNPKDSSVLVTPVMGEKTDLPPIVIRETAEGTTFINLNSFTLHPPSALNYKIIDRTDNDTKTYVAVHSKNKSLKDACNTHLDSFEELSRGILLAKCPH
ncbi:MAG: phosphoethanolamine transferase [Polaromonas sp.]